MSFATSRSGLVANGQLWLQAVTFTLADAVVIVGLVSLSLISHHNTFADSSCCLSFLIKQA